MGGFRAPSLVTLDLSSLERDMKTLSQRSMQKGLEALHRDGIVVVKDVVSHKDIDRLNEAMQHDARTLMERGEDGPFNYNLGNLQQGPPLNDPSLLSPSIFLSPFATQITSAYLGGRPMFSFMSGNTALHVPGDQASKAGQPVHSDADFAHPAIPFACVVNVGLCEMNPGNGSTELWLGTHNGTGVADQEGAHGERTSGRIKQSLLEERRKVSPPLQPVVSKGSLIVRDLRLWHAGRASSDPTPRVMLAFIHFAPWYRQRMTLRLPKTLRQVFEEYERGLNVVAEWVDGEVNHLASTYGNAFDFDQDP